MAAKKTKLVAQAKEFQDLRVYNAVMGFFHLVQAIAMIAISNSFSLPLQTSYVAYDRAVGKAVTDIQQIGSLRIGPAVAVFLLLSAIAHFLLATVLYDWYVRNLKHNANYARWFEYALSSSLMIVIIGLLCGMYDLPALIILFALNACMILFGYMMELHNQTTTKTDWTSYIFGCFAGLVPWVALGMYFFGAAAEAGSTIPTFVYFMFGSIFFFFMLFAINMPLQYAKVGKWKNYLFGERVYVLLSLVAKSALAWQIWSGTLRG